MNKQHERFLEINGSQLRYIESGSGDPILFLHGIPTHAFLWRHVIDSLSPYARCIAPDLIGMGFSDKPDIEYSVFDHINYIESFINQLKLTNITLVAHGWGSVIGLAIAHKNPSLFNKLAYYESHLRAPHSAEMLSLPVQQLASNIQSQEQSYVSVIEEDFFIEKLLPLSSLESLSPDVMEQYRQPFATCESRKPLWAYLQELPLGREETKVTQLIDGYSQWLTECPKAKLLLYAWPGFITTMDTIMWAKENQKNITVKEVGNALHLAPETIPEQFSECLLDWYKKSS